MTAPSQTPPLGDALRSDAPGFARSSVLTMGSPVFWNAFSEATTEAPALLKNRGVAERVITTHGSFFDGVPSGGDVYILSHIIHDWSDEHSLSILKRCREAMKSDGRLLLIELVLNEEGVSGFGSADLVMMTLPGGAERTATEYADLFSRAGLSLSRVVKTTTSTSIIEAVCAAEY